MQDESDNASRTPDSLQGLTDEQTERLSLILDRYLAGLESGEPLDLGVLLDANADIRKPLERYIGRLGGLHNLAAGFSPHLAADPGDFPGEARFTDGSHTQLLSGQADSVADDDFAMAFDFDLPNSSNAQVDYLEGQPSPSASDDGSKKRDSIARPVGTGTSGDRVAGIDSQLNGSGTRRLGDYELLRIAGRGGMGVVYEAKQLSLGRRVALKLLPLISVLDARQITRFKNEAQAAASLQHPHIVPVYAVGNYRGVHYYAMRFIDGHAMDAIIAALRKRRDGDPDANSSRSARLDKTRPESFGSEPTIADAVTASSLDVDKSIETGPASASNSASNSAGAADHSEAGRRRPLPSAGEGWSLPTDTRRILQLGIEAATAVAAAHAEGIVHRDIKPSNLLIDREGKLWVTDFGLARRIDDHSLTASGDVLGTLRYMSPEQARGESALIDGRTDIYSLGVTLYELLTLEPAIVGDNPGAMMQAIENQQPIALRHHRRDLPRDLATVIETAIAKDRDERYLTAQRFADDLSNVLEGRSTLAKPPTPLMRATKWALRHRVIVSTAVIALIVLGVGLSISMIVIARESLIAKANAQYAMQSATDLRFAVDIASAEMLDEIEPIPGTEAAQRKLLKMLSSFYIEFAEGARSKFQPRVEVADALIRSGELNRKLGDLPESERTLRKADEIIDELRRSEPRNMAYQKMATLCDYELGRMQLARGNIDAAEQSMSDAITLGRELAESNPDEVPLQINLSRARNGLALLLSETGRVDQAKVLLTESRTQLQDCLQRSSPVHAAASTLRETTSGSAKDLKGVLAATLNNLCSVISQSDPEAAAALYRSSIDLLRTSVAESDGAIGPQMQLAVAYSNHGTVLRRLGQLDQAAEAYQNATAIQQPLHSVAPSSPRFARDLAVTLNNLGIVQGKLNQFADAEKSYRRAIALQQPWTDSYPDDAQLAHHLGGVYNNLAQLLEVGANAETIESAYREAIRYQRRALELSPQVASYREFLDNHLKNYSHWLRKSQRDEQALAEARARQSLWPDKPPQLIDIARDLANAAIETSNASKRQAVADRYAEAAFDILRLVQQTGFEVQSVLAQEPFSSLAKLPR